MTRSRAPLKHASEAGVRRASASRERVLALDASHSDQQRGVSARTDGAPRPERLEAQGISGGAEWDGFATAEECLVAASRAEEPELRELYARRGLKLTDDVEMHGLLFRQLYLVQMERSEFERALEYALKASATKALPDISEQDVARAYLGLKQPELAVQHMRLASRVAPPARRAFHLWTLGSTLYLAGRYAEAVFVLKKALMWGTRDKPLYRAQWALARLRAGDEAAREELEELRDHLEMVPCGRGYGQFVLGELAFFLEEYSIAEELLQGFVARSGRGRVALKIALQAELAHAEGLLQEIQNTHPAG